MHPAIVTYNNAQPPAAQEVCRVLAAAIDRGLTGAESKIWHRHPVWFLDGNPIVGYSTQKAGVRLMFWSGADFDEPKLNVYQQVGRTHRDLGFKVILRLARLAVDLGRFDEAVRTLRDASPFRPDRSCYPWQFALVR